MNDASEQAYTVRGMSCTHCEASVREEVEELDGVASATPDHTTGSLLVVGDVDEGAVRAAVAEAGYELVP